MRATLWSNNISNDIKLWEKSVAFDAEIKQ